MRITRLAIAFGLAAGVAGFGFYTINDLMNNRPAPVTDPNPFGTANAQRTDGPEKFEFVASTGLDGSRTALKLPEGWVFCARVDDKGLKARPNRRNATITGVETKKEWTVSVGLTNKCGLAAKDGGARDIALVLLGPVVATDDIESIAFEWDPSAPRKLVIRVESAALANSTQIRNQTSLALPAFPSRHSTRPARAGGSTLRDQFLEFAR